MSSIGMATVGVDLGDRFSYCCNLDPQGEVTQRFKLRTTKTAFRSRFDKRDRCRVVIETSTHSPWVSRILAECGHEVVVANARRVALISQSTKKTDREDCETLARLGRADPQLLAPIRHRGLAAQCDLGVLRARSAVVRARGLLINSVRGLVKSVGARLPGCSTAAFDRKVREHIPAELTPATHPLLEQIRSLSETIKAFDKQISGLCKRHAVTEHLQRVTGVGPLVSLAYVLTIEDPDRFRRSRQVGAYLGLVPRLAESGDMKKQLRITKAGDVNLRALLVVAAQHILGPWGQDSDLRRWGLTLAERGGANGKKRAVVAVARRLAVLLHHLWKTGEVYDPLHVAKRRGEADDPTKARPPRARKKKISESAA